MNDNEGGGLTALELLQRLTKTLLNGATDEEVAEISKGKTWTADEMTAEFAVEQFAAPLVYVRRKSDGVLGTLMFRHAPRVYFGWEEV